MQKKSFCNGISGDSLLIWKKMHLLTRVGLLIGGVLFARRTHANDTRRASLTRTLIMFLRTYFSTVQFLFLFCISILLSQRYVCLGLFMFRQSVMLLELLLLLTTCAAAVYLFLSCPYRPAPQACS